ncbi:restriction endonuclease subunit S [Campylobacter upsaliensis]|uniref:restriction endonuclease subunit S n=1 Tax=Campylobacter upsaliensis TaxID=28080 RepID=UPI0013093764|nr:restriction endonuclease subunit S [Campylobacter upsaliensis]ECV9716674.1 restriction endonuclease subunit S [Campylobacter upsaliensis]MBT0799978.1 restriction endonuclease subunit S [Campylobacter upsaliensis]
MKPLNNTTHPLESLLQQHCPNGVEFKELGELWEKAPKSKMGANQAKNLSKNNGNICFTSGETHYFIDDYLVDGEFLFLNDGGTADIKYNSGKAYYTDHIFAFTSQKICVKFLYYFLKDKQEAINKTCFQGTGLKNLQKNKIEKFPIPLPPLEIQHKIVEILDAFTELQAELQAELEARLKQYHYYRNKLLSHDELENRTAKSRNDSDPTPIVPYVRLGEVCEKVFAGGDLPKEYSKDKKPSGEFLYPIYSNGSDENSLYGFSKTYRIDAEAVTISARGTIGFHTTREAKFTPIVRLITLIPNLNKITNRFLNYALYTTHIEKYGTSAGIPQLTIPMLEKITIPLPPLSVQEEIVELLDKFDTLTNDLTSGIPAEIEARKKQYEYYRERLLSFIAKD